MEIIKKYTNGDVTIVWQPKLCIHSTVCWKAATGLPHVFNPALKPWIKPENAATEVLIEQVKKCPSGALTYFMNTEGQTQQQHIETECIVETMPDGPLMVFGNITIKERDGSITKKNNITAFCRCGASSNKPYCDGSHSKVGFKE